MSRFQAVTAKRGVRGSAGAPLGPRVREHRGIRSQKQGCQGEGHVPSERLAPDPTWHPPQCGQGDRAGGGRRLSKVTQRMSAYGALAMHPCATDTASWDPGTDQHGLRPPTSNPPAGSPLSLPTARSPRRLRPPQAGLRRALPSSLGGLKHVASPGPRRAHLCSGAASSPSPHRGISHWYHFHAIVLTVFSYFLYVWCADLGASLSPPRGQPSPRHS